MSKSTQPNLTSTEGKTQPSSKSPAKPTLKVFQNELKDWVIALQSPHKPHPAHLGLFSSKQEAFRFLPLYTKSLKSTLKPLRKPTKELK
jgi:hypothetical protein